MKGIHFIAMLASMAISFIAYFSSAQSNEKDEMLNLENAGYGIQNIINIHTSNSEYDKIISVSGQKKTLRKPHIIINGDSAVAIDIHTRGNTTLHYPRKNFSISLDDGAKFRHGNATFKMKKFNANCLSMDKYYFRNRLAFELMEELKIFGLFYTYGEIQINGNSEGIYLIVERPRDFALKHKDSPLVIRRGYDHQIEKIKTRKNVDKPEVKNYRNYYTQIYKSLNRYQGEELYKELSQLLDVEMYMQWLGFNFFIRNGDYTDEVYLYIEPAEDRFKIIPWDYDDIFARTPHEGNMQKQKKSDQNYFFLLRINWIKKLQTIPIYIRCI